MTTNNLEAVAVKIIDDLEVALQTPGSVDYIAFRSRVLQPLKEKLGLVEVTPGTFEQNGQPFDPLANIGDVNALIVAIDMIRDPSYLEQNQLVVGLRNRPDLSIAINVAGIESQDHYTMVEVTATVTLAVMSNEIPMQEVEA